MPTSVAHSLATPSYKAGYARNAGESAQPNLWKGLVGAWLTSLGPTGLTLFDVSGKNNGTLINMDPSQNWVLDEQGYTLDYDGNFERVATTRSMSSMPETTIACWVRRRTTGAIVSVASNTLFGSQITQLLWFTDGLLYLNMGQGGGIPTISSNTTDWLHTVFTFNGRIASPKHRLYFDGVLQVTGGTEFGVTSSHAEAGTLDIGRRASGPQNTDGFIGDVLVYDRAITADEAQQLYTDSLAPFRLRPQVISAVAEVAATVGDLQPNQQIMPVF